MFALTLALALTAAPAPKIVHCQRNVDAARERHEPVCTPAQVKAAQDKWLADFMAVALVGAQSAVAAQAPSVTALPYEGVAAAAQGGNTTYRVHVNGEAYSVTVME